MSYSYTVDMSGPIFTDPELLAELWHQKIVLKYIGAASSTRDNAEADAPVGETGDLRASSNIDSQGLGSPGEFYVDVGFGEGLPFTQVDYSYPEGMSTSVYPDGGMEADNYSLIVELGHMTVNGGHVAAQPFLGPNFDSGVQDLLDELDGLLD